jgi:hypothetical protein
MNTTTYDIPAYNYPTLCESVEKLNRRAVKLGCEPMTLTVIREYTVEKKNEDTGAKYSQARIEFNLTGETPRYEGWRLLASVEMQPSSENLIRCVPGETVPESYRKTDTHCDHCHSNRRRKEVFILGHDNGTMFAQVGRQCIADFLGHASAETLVARATWMFDIEHLCDDADGEGFSGRGERMIDMADFLATVAIIIRRIGWISAKVANEKFCQSTAQLAWTIITDAKSESIKKFIRENSIVSEERDSELAAAALEWARNQPTEGVVDYLYNLGVSCRLPYVTYRTAGIIASSIAAYQRHLDKQNELYIERTTKERNHLGEVGKRADFTGLTIKRMRYFDSPFGVKTLVTFETATGSVLVWWASKELDGVEEGDMVSIRGTVKKHSEYKGMPQTELSRVQITKEEIPA